MQGNYVSLLHIAAIFTTFSFTAPVSAEIIDFDDSGLSNGMTITHHYTDVTFNSIPNPFPIFGAFPISTTVPAATGGVIIYNPNDLTAPGESPPNFAISSDGGYGGILMTFKKPISSIELIGLDFGGSLRYDTEAITLAAYDREGEYIGQDFFYKKYAYGAVQGSLEFPSMKYVTFNYTNTLFGFYGIDNVVYTPQKPTVLLDPGHGLLLGDDGELHYQRPATETYNLHEDDLSLSMAHAAKAYLEENGYEVILTRSGKNALYTAPCGTPNPDDDTIFRCNPDLQLRMQIARELKEEDEKDVVFASIHTNGGQGRRLKGRTQTYYCTAESRPLAQRLLDNIEEVVPPVRDLNDKPINVPCGDYGVLRRTAEMEIPSSIAEALYHNNDDDEELLNNAGVRAQIGNSIGTAVIEFIELDFD